LLSYFLHIFILLLLFSYTYFGPYSRRQKKMLLILEKGEARLCQVKQWDMQQDYYKNYQPGSLRLALAKSVCGLFSVSVVYRFHVSTGPSYSAWN
jgi:hypothetical protein